MPAASPQAAPLLRFSRVRKSFGAVVAVRELSFDLAPREAVALLGAKGAGKSAALTMLAGFTAPDDGEINFGGASLAGVAPHRRGIGVMFPAPALFAHLSVAENVAFPLAVRGIARAERRQRVAAALDRTRLAGLDARMPQELSLAEQQRVALARALVFAPALLVMDEPLAALEEAERAALAEDIARLRGELGLTLLHATRDPALAVALSDRIGVMEQGELRQLDTPQALYETPASLSVARLLGETNLLPGEMLADDDLAEEGLARVRLAGGGEVEARLAGARPGRRCVVAVRPERVAVAAAAAEDMGEGALSARLLEAAYRGDHLRLRLSLEGGGELTVRRPAGVPMGGLAIGQPAAIAWQPHHAAAFEAPP